MNLEKLKSAIQCEGETSKRVRCKKWTRHPSSLCDLCRKSRATLATLLPDATRPSAATKGVTNL